MGSQRSLVGPRAWQRLRWPKLVQVLGNEAAVRECSNYGDTLGGGSQASSDCCYWRCYRCVGRQEAREQLARCVCVSADLANALLLIPIGISVVRVADLPPAQRSDGHMYSDDHHQAERSRIDVDFAVATQRLHDAMQLKSTVGTPRRSARAVVIAPAIRVVLRFRTTSLD